jgi:hypothetical protein
MAVRVYKMWWKEESKKGRRRKKWVPNKKINGCGLGGV